MKGTPRLRAIAAVLVRHGLGYVVGALGIDALVPFHRGLLGHPRRMRVPSTCAWRGSLGAYTSDPICGRVSTGLRR